MMTITYRTTGAWGAGKGANLTPAEVDGNFYDLATRVTAVEDNPIQPAQIDNITSSGSALTITMDNGDIYGPLTLPTAAFVYRGAWAASTSYAKNDVVVVSSKLYLVAVAHTSDTTFNASRVISGVTVYQLMFDVAAESVAAVGSVLQSGTHDGITFTYNSGANTITADVTAATYTDEQAQDAVASALAAGSHTGISFSYNDASNAISAAVSVTQYTDEMAQDAVATALSAGTHSGITFTYNDAANSISASVTAGSVTVQEGGSTVVSSANTFNFDATGFNVTNVGGVATIAVAAGAAGGAITVQEGGSTVLASATTLNFDATGFNITDVGGVATIGVSAAAGSGVDVKEGGTVVVSGATAINFDATNFNVTNVSGVPTVSVTSGGAAGGSITSGTAVATTSGTLIDLSTSIPSGVKRITVMFQGVSTNGVDKVVIQLGTSAGYVTTGYLGSASVNGTSQANVLTGLATSNHVSASDVRHGTMVITNISGNDWVSTASIGLSNGSSMGHGASSVSLPGTLDRIRLTTAGMLNSFDAGSVNILYE